LQIVILERLLISRAKDTCEAGSHGVWSLSEGRGVLRKSLEFGVADSRYRKLGAILGTRSRVTCGTAPIGLHRCHQIVLYKGRQNTWLGIDSSMPLNCKVARRKLFCAAHHSRSSAESPVNSSWVMRCLTIGKQ
jgi:hypothetical protein